MKYFILCDFREDFPNLNMSGKRYYNDHPRKESVEEICNILNKNGYDCEIFGGTKKLIDYYNNKKDMPEGVYVNMSDGLNEEYNRVQIPIICDLLNIQYSGGNPFLVGLICNKYYSNQSVRELGINVPNSILTDKYYPLVNSSLSKLKLPIIVKPNNDGSSYGINDSSICYSYEDVINIYSKLLKTHNEILVQEYVDGYEVTNMLVGNPNNYILNEVSIVIKNGTSYFKNCILTQDDKANKTAIKDAIAENYLEINVIDKIKASTKLIFEELMLKDIIRVDYRISKNGDIYFIEMNSVPRISSTTEIVKMCENANISFENFLCEYFDSISKRLNHESK